MSHQEVGHWKSRSDRSATVVPTRACLLARASSKPANPDARAVVADREQQVENHEHVAALERPRQPGLSVLDDVGCESLRVSKALARNERIRGSSSTIRIRISDRRPHRRPMEPRPYTSEDDL